MVDDRSSNFSSGRVSFSKADNSGIVSGLPDKKRSKDENQEFDDVKKDSDNDNSENLNFVDRSAQLRSALNFLAMINMPKIIKNKQNPENIDKSK